jgi:hypothetical protein
MATGDTPGPQTSPPASAQTSPPASPPASPPPLNWWQRLALLWEEPWQLAVWAVVLALVYAAVWVVGYFAGWVVGNSRAPVAAALVPLIPALLAVITIGLFEKRIFLDKVLQTIKSAESDPTLDKSTLAKIPTLLAEHTGFSFLVLAGWAVGAILFCWACYIGIGHGIIKRVPKYPAVSELIDHDHPPSPAEYGMLHELHWQLHSNLTPVDEVEALFHDTINPILATQENDMNYAEQWRHRSVRLQYTVDRILHLQATDQGSAACCTFAGPPPVTGAAVPIQPPVVYERMPMSQKAYERYYPP